MLCEGVLLYMMLVTVFGNKLNRRCFFFVLGWGKSTKLLNQARAGLWPAHAWFLKITFVQLSVCLCLVCVCPQGDE